MKTEFFLMICMIISSTGNLVHAQGNRAIIDNNLILSYGAVVPVGELKGMKLMELSVGQLTSNGDISSQLVFIDPKEGEKLKTLDIADTIYVDVVRVKYINGRFIEASDSDKSTAPVVFKYGIKHKIPSFANIFDINDDYRTLGYLDLEHIIFYPMSFKKSKGSVSGFQTAMTVPDATDQSDPDKVKMQLVNFLNSDKELADLKTLGSTSRIESATSIWSKKKNKFILSGEEDSPWKSERKTAKYTIEKVWGVRLFDEKLDKKLQSRSSNGNQNPKQLLSVDSTKATSSVVTNPTKGGLPNRDGIQMLSPVQKPLGGDSALVSWNTLSGATKYTITLYYDNKGGSKVYSPDVSENNTSRIFRKLTPGYEYKMIVIAYGQGNMILKSEEAILKL